eukprot:403362171
MKSYKQLNLPFVVNASLSFNVTLQGSTNVEYVENEEFELLVDPNKYVTVIFVDFDIDKYDYVKIPKFDAPLSGVFRDVVFNLTHPHIPSKQHLLTVRCFLTKRKNNYTSLGYSGYLGIAPFRKDLQMNERFSFTQQLRSIMNIQSNKLGIHYYIHKNFDLGLNSGPGKLKVESTDKMNPFENVQAIDLGNYMRSLKIQEYHHFDNSTYDSSHSTFVNMSEYGIFLNSEYYSYMHDSFLIYNCYYKEDKYKLCMCSGNNFQGMPHVQMLTESLSFSMYPYDYLLYPIIQQSTRVTRCILSLQINKDKTYDVSTQDYVLGQAFFALFNPMFVIDFSDESNPQFSLYIQGGGPIQPHGMSFLISMICISVFTIIMITLFTRNKRLRLTIQYKKWKDIKELQDDYEVYVTDEYSYHINDVRMQIEHLQQIENSGDNQQTRRSGLIGNQSAFDKADQDYTSQMNGFGRPSIVSINHTHAPILTTIGSINRFSSFEQRPLLEESTSPNKYNKLLHQNSKIKNQQQYQKQQTKRTLSHRRGRENSDSDLQ